MAPVLVKNSSSKRRTVARRYDGLFNVSKQTVIFSQRPELHQHTFELNFQVDHLRVSISKSGADGGEKPLGDVSLERFALVFALAKFDMNVDINLRYAVVEDCLSTAE